MQKVAGNVYVGTNICNHSFVKTSEGLVAIDTPTIPEASVAWQKEIAKHGKVRYLIDTEGHYDHFAGNYFFDTTIVGHEAARREIEASTMEELKGMIANMAPGSAPLPDGFYLRPPAITFSRELTLYVGDRTFRLINTPGHTAGQATVYVPEEKVAFTGDNVVNKSMPFFHQALPLEWLESLKVLDGLDIDVVVPGHGSVGDASCIREMRSTVQTWVDAVREAIKKGMSQEETMDKVSLLHLYPDPNADPQRRAAIQRMGIGRLYQMLKGPLDRP